MKFRASYPLFLVLVASAANSTSADSTDCLNGLRAALVAGGFSGSTDCKRDELSISYLGEVRRSGRTFDIYVNRYKLNPPCPECAVHGGQRIIILERGQYVGQYRADFTNASVRDGRLFLRADMLEAKAVEVKFTKAGPPRKQWDGSDVLLLFK